MNSQIEESNKHLEALAVKLTPLLETLGLTCAVVSENKHGEALEREEKRILIKYPGLPYFSAEIMGRSWNDYGKASLWLESDVVQTFVVGRCHDGEPITKQDKHTFTSFLSTEELNLLSVPYENYRHCVRSLHKVFKIDKNIKLIWNDLKSALVTYREVVRVASPRIDARIISNTNTLKLINSVAQRAEYYHGEITELKDWSGNIEGVGRVAISYYGSITLTKELSAEELKALLGIQVE